MQKEKHAQYQDVLFVDSTTGLKFVCGTTFQSEQKEVYEGRELPVVVVPISSASHPLFVGGKQIVDSAGCVDKFRKRYETPRKPQPKAEEKSASAPAKKASKKKA